MGMNVWEERSEVRNREESDQHCTELSSRKRSGMIRASSGESCNDNNKSHTYDQPIREKTARHARNRKPHLAVTKVPDALALAATQALADGAKDHHQRQLEDEQVHRNAVHLQQQPHKRRKNEPSETRSSFKPTSSSLRVSLSLVGPLFLPNLV